jgi:hypothetical protein
MVTLASTITEYTKVRFYKPKKTTMIIAIIFLCTALVGVLWIRGIDNMSKEHSEYNGNDLI